MDLNNPVIQLCVQGTQAEFAGRPADARALYAQAWKAASDDFEACVAAHYVARFQDSPQAALEWHRLALAHADAVDDDRVQAFYPSLYVNIGRAYELLGSPEQAGFYYQLAAALGLDHSAE